MAEDQKVIDDLSKEFLDFSIENLNISSDSNINNSNSLNNKNETNENNKHSLKGSSRINYFKKILSNYYSNKKFSEFLNGISIKNVKSIKNIKDFYEICLKNSKKNPILIGPINRVVINEYEDDFIIDIDEMTIPMSHIHLNEKINFPKTDFCYMITGSETGPLKLFIERIRLFDNYIKKLIQEYIKNINKESPIYELLKKNNVTTNNNWYYSSIINENSSKKYLNINYNKISFNKNFKIGTMIYHGEDLVINLMDMLADDTKNTYISGNIYPIIKISTIVVYEKIINGEKVVSFKPKVYFADIIAKKNTLKYGIKYKSPLEYCKGLLNYYNSGSNFSKFLNEITIKNVTPCTANNNFYFINLKNSNNTPIFIGPINKTNEFEKEINNEDSLNFYINLDEMTLPMRHYHINEKFRFINSSFYYLIEGNENNSIKLFLNHVKKIDKYLKNLVQDYIKNVNKESPLYSLLKKNNVTADKLWKYIGIISKNNGREYLSIDFIKRSYYNPNQIGSKIYNDKELIIDLMKQLADDSKNTYVYGDIYPLIKINSIIVYEKKTDIGNIVCFKTKAYIPNIIIKKDTLKYGIIKKKND
ncbi:hypothetical protein LY90DRAFT_677625 [Neocallimastix californiae]|uniref:Uncharacterized protein n=1 Tax=Neocallimastix californiae TaxID=1754190 RepID=A0A1Y1ZXI1_9FUNG|nr:hypothetical protein LY90DRAFT_677625 [Neocallimastix californiae]|eukprot:ORY14485.1 hypothetical protein LY90DRAFT_677625 [Neocallimastix californiae]